MLLGGSCLLQRRVHIARPAPVTDQGVFSRMASQRHLTELEHTTSRPIVTIALSQLVHCRRAGDCFTHDTHRGGVGGTTRRGYL